MVTTPASSRPTCARPRARRSRMQQDCQRDSRRRPSRFRVSVEPTGGTAMDAIEPHWVSLLWFAGFATVCTVAFLIVSGMFPLRARPDSARSGVAIPLIVGNAVLLAVLSTGTGVYGLAELRWSTL